MIAAFSISPLGTGESVGRSVAGAVRIVRESGLPNETNAMFTNVEGSWDEVMDVLRRCVDDVSTVSERVSVVVKLDIRGDVDTPGGTGRLVAKTATVERHLADG
ncbi:MAG: thiamine-binding protein [Actinomycetota bacterium]|nr:thiamine-binding protein [Actinomycetota bacterium]